MGINGVFSVSSLKVRCDYHANAEHSKLFFLPKRTVNTRKTPDSITGDLIIYVEFYGKESEK